MNLNCKVQFKLDGLVPTNATDYDQNITINSLNSIYLTARKSGGATELGRAAIRYLSANYTIKTWYVLPFQG
jgi:hypothetical protein